MTIGFTCRDFERKLVRHCAPTLAALKPANLFTCCDTYRAGAPHARGTTSCYEDDLSCALHAARKKLGPCNVRIEVLARRSSGALIYVYRPDLVMHDLANASVSAFLAKEGYDTASLSACITRLHRRICGTDLQSQLSGRCTFPHEIGFFLGYPYEDVVRFIENEGRNELCCGCWKVYSQKRDATASFCRYKTCTAMYQNLFDSGTPIERLASLDENESLRATLLAAG